MSDIMEYDNEKPCLFLRAHFHFELIMHNSVLFYRLTGHLLR